MKASGQFHISTILLFVKGCSTHLTVYVKYTVNLKHSLLPEIK